MKILLLNDDGIHAPGLREAVRVLCRFGELFVVAPDREQSGVGASLTLHSPVKVREVPVASLLNEDEPLAFKALAYAVEGTPADCCVLGLEKLVGSVDLVVSGINSGSNLGWDVMVSGTVGGAIQGFVRGYSTIAISVGSVQNPLFEPAGRVLELVCQRLMEDPPETNLFLNINVPNLSLAEMSGVQITRLGGRSYGESVREEGVGPRKRYWIARDRSLPDDSGTGTDIWASKNRQISITPLHIGLGHDEQLATVESFLADLPAQLLSQKD